jgi:hypothetical protein
MDLNWCCSEFESRIYAPGTDGFKTLVVIRAKGGVSCYVQFQPRGKSPKDLRTEIPQKYLSEGQCPVSP